MTLPLAGIKVVDISQVYMGPGAAMYLADQGADVVKLEPLQGETMRLSQSTPYLSPRGFSTPFLALNRNKRGIAVDLRTPDGQEIAHRLARWADVLILNFQHGSEARVRLDYETLAALNPRLVYANISAFGREGPDAQLPGYDITIQSRSGILSMRRDASGRPIPCPVIAADMSGCMGLAYAIMLALWQREQTGSGQRVDVSLLQFALAMQMQWLVWVESDPRPIYGQQVLATHSCYRCSDGEWINVVIVQDSQFRQLCRVLDLADLDDDPRFASYDLRVAHTDQLFDILDTAFAKHPLAEWTELLRTAGVPASRVVQREELPEDVQTKANRMFWDQEHPSVGVIKMIAPPFHLSESIANAHPRRPAPALGEHTGEVLRALGYDDDSIEGLRRRRTVL